MLIVLGLRLVTTNSDNPDLLIKDLGVEPTWERLSRRESLGSSRLSDDNGESEYEDDEYEIETYDSFDEEGRDIEGSLNSPFTEDDSDESQLQHEDNEYEPETHDSPDEEGQVDMVLLISPLSLDDSEASEYGDQEYEPGSNDDSGEDMEEKKVSTIL